MSDAIVLTARSTAELLQVSEATAKRLIYSGALPSFTIGACRRVPRDAVEAYVRAKLSAPALASK